MAAVISQKPSYWLFTRVEESARWARTTMRGALGTLGCGAPHKMQFL